MPKSGGIGIRMSPVMREDRLKAAGIPRQILADLDAALAENQRHADYKVLSQIFARQWFGV